MTAAYQTRGALHPIHRPLAFSCMQGGHVRHRMPREAAVTKRLRLKLARIESFGAVDKLQTILDVMSLNETHGVLERFGVPPGGRCRLPRAIEALTRHRMSWMRARDAKQGVRVSSAAEITVTLAVDASP